MIFSAHLSLAATSGEGLLTERRTAPQPWRRELAFMPDIVEKVGISPSIADSVK
jgi:hypothetical protein